MYSPKKIVSLCVALLGLAIVAVLITTGTMTASPHLNPVAAAPTPPSVPVNVVNTPLPVTGTVNANIATPVAVSSLPAITGNVNATLTNSR